MSNRQIVILVKKALRLRQFDVCVRPKLLTPSQLKRTGKLLNLFFKGGERENIEVESKCVL